MRKDVDKCTAYHALYAAREAINQAGAQANLAAAEADFVFGDGETNPAIAAATACREASRALGREMEDIITREKEEAEQLATFKRNMEAKQ